MEIKKTSNNYFDGLQVTSIHKVLFYVIMLAYFFEQMDNWNFGFVAPVLIKTWGLTMGDIGTIQFFYFIGMTLGGLTGGVISDMFGRRRTFLGAILLFSTASVINGFAPNLTIFIISRALTGFGIFCLMVTSQAYIAEMAPGETRGKWQGKVAAAGFMAVPFIGILCRAIIPMSPEAWRYIFFLGGFGFIVFFIGVKYLKESPRWLVSKGRVDEAEKIVYDLSGVNVDLKEAASKNSPSQNPFEVVSGMFTRKYIKRTLVLFIWMFCTVPAAFVVTGWTPTLLVQRGLSVQDSLTASFILMIGVPVGCYISSLVSDKGGRKIPMAILSGLAGMFALIFGRVTGFIPVIIVGFCLIACIMAVGFISFTYIAESYPTKMRNTSIGFHNAVGRTATAVVQALVPIIYLQYQFVGVYNLIVMMSWLPIVVLMVWGMSTGGKALEDID